MNELNLKNYPRRNYAIDQFTQPHYSELEGKRFHFIMDGGYDFDLKFTGEDACEWNIAGEEPKAARYACLKGDDTTYIVDYDLVEFLDTPNRVNHCFVIDLEQRLVTMAVHAMGRNPRFPYLVKSEYDFGAIEVEGMELPMKRHCFTKQLVGTHVAWILGCGRFTSQDFYETGMCRIAWSPRENEPYEQPCKATRIKGPIYLVDISGRVRQGVCAPFFTNRVIMLQDYDRMMTVGCVMGRGFDPIMISGYAKFLN